MLERLTTNDNAVTCVSIYFIKIKKSRNQENITNCVDFIYLNGEIEAQPGIGDKIPSII